jgi:SAM-dependent methyltransferase
LFSNKNGLRIPDFPKKILNFPIFYNCLQEIGGHNRTVKYVLEKYNSNLYEREVIDLGCGTGKALTNLPKFEKYTGVDIHEPYIRKLIKENPKPNCKFLKGSALDLKGVVPKTQTATFIALGFLHHLSESEVDILFTEIRQVCEKPKIITLDPVFCDDQTRLSKFLANSDRGNYVRWDKELHSLICGFGGKILDSEINNSIMRTKMNVAINMFEL